ncbi:hypothetical protein PR202_ga22584 [Eleusine coracana subsp. coracana]|uniref:Uncharacterized protein n=1 Tax=Eleusine coracana subsp. coracana TaxID=191504 RepID=A0AAV5D239_ELECO|nr:hypothetical protein PR202_ga22584 [Eleusine coracana subsp. coracana]
MCAMLLPLGFVDTYDAQRRAFLWSREQETSGASCVVAWDRVCLPKEQGGLGIRDIALQNQCLLLKLVHKHPSPIRFSLGNMSHTKINILTLEGDVHGAHWASLSDLLPPYRAITTVTLGDGRFALFWEDIWAQATTVAMTYSALYSHSKDTNASVHHIVNSGLDSNLVPRLTTAATLERLALETLIQSITLTSAPDIRCSPLFSPSGSFRSAPIYKTVTAATSPTSPFYKHVSCNCVPPRVQYFAWLLVQE